MKRLNVIFGILLIACVGIGGVPSSAPRVLAADGPDPATLLQQSITTMKGSLHTARSAGKSTITASGQKAAFTITGTCALTGTRLNAQLHLKGTTIGQKKPVALNEQDGLIWSQSPGWVAVFTRPAGQGKAWQSIDPFDSTGAGMFGLGCPLITVAQMEQQPPANLTLLGPATIGTEAAWHLRSTVKATGSTQTINLYIGQQSLFLLRVGATVNASQLKQTSTMDYSAFNDPVTIALPSVTPLPGRALHTAVRLSDGRVLVLGGVGLSSEKAPIVKAWTEVYDPSTGTWSQAGSLPAVPIMPSIAVAGGGGVLMSAYFYPTSAATNQQFDQTTNTWINAPKSLVARLVPVAAALKDGRVLLAGGYNVVAGQVETSAEIYDPVAGTWTKTGNLNESRAMGALSALLKDGRLLVMGGTTNGTLSAE
ncbi:MAG TPA: kelch repeat-containing protein, partial [Chloroflexota bacterium]